MCSSSPVRTPKLQLVGEQSSTGECWFLPKKILHVQGQRRSPNKTVGGAKSCLESNPIAARDAWRAQTNLVCTRTQRPHRDWTSIGSLKESWCLGSTDSDSALSGYGFSIELISSLTIPSPQPSPWATISLFSEPLSVLLVHLCPFSFDSTYNECLCYRLDSTYM